MKKLFEQIISGSLRQLPAEVTAESAPEGDAEEHFKAIVKTFEIASLSALFALAKQRRKALLNSFCKVGMRGEGRKCISIKAVENGTIAT